MTKWYGFSWSAEVEADSLEEAKEMFVDAEWYEDEPQDITNITYSLGEEDEDGDITWEEIEED